MKFHAQSGHSRHHFASIMHPPAPGWSDRNTVPAWQLPRFWRDWLLDQGSLTARISALRPGTFNVQVVQQYTGRPTTVEQQALKLSARQSVWVREVILRLGDTPLVYARTAIPLSSLRGDETRLRRLGNRSLGSYLFRQPSLRRTPLQVSHCRANDLGVQWSRRSVFILHGKPLLVTEAFASELADFAC